MTTHTESTSPEPVARQYASERPHRYQRDLLPLLLDGLAGLPAGARILDAGCGNGFISGELLKHGFRVIGVDVSASGIDICRRSYPEAEFHIASVGDPDLVRIVGNDFDGIVASEVIEHLYAPADFFANGRRLLKDGGVLVLSTPYHGYLKNLLLALTGAMEAHLQPDHEGGHIKFWSRCSLELALRGHGFRVGGFKGCGRIPFLWKSMVVKAVKAE